MGNTSNTVGSGPAVWGQEGGTIAEIPNGEETVCVVPEIFEALNVGVGNGIHHIDTNVGVYDAQGGGGESGNIDDVENPPEDEEKSVVNDHDKKCCSGSLDTDENPDKCEKSHLAGMQNGKGGKCRLESLKKETDVDDGEKSHSESTDSVVDDRDKKCCSWSLDTEENPNNCGKGHIVGVKNDESEKCRIESLENESDVQNDEKGHQVFMDHSKTDQGGKSHEAPKPHDKLNGLN